MRRLLALLAACAIALTVMAPVASAQGDPATTGWTVQSVTIDKMGIVDVRGYFYCQNVPDGTWVHQDGQVVQSIGRKTLIAGGVDAYYECVDGPTFCDTRVQAYYGTFGTGRATVQLGSRVWWCRDPNDQNSCGEIWVGGTEAYVKVIKK
jgi:hypothetical protein